MIQPWQFVVMALIVLAFIAYSLYDNRLTAARDDAFFEALETGIARAVAGHGYELSNRTHAPKSFDDRAWYFSRDGSRLVVHWYGRDREVGITFESAASSRGDRQRLGPWQLPFNRRREESYARVLDELVAAATAAVMKPSQGA